MGETAGWEELRKQARQLENEIDLKLVSFCKLGTGYCSPGRHGGSESLPLLSNDRMFETMSLEIEQLLEKLASVNDKLSENSTARSTSAAIGHTVQRHLEILKDYQNEFMKTKANIQTKLHREDLLGSLKKDHESNKTNRLSRTELLVKEGEYANNCSRHIDEQINMALETREHLINQREAYKLIQTKMNDLSNKFPIINNLVQRINFRKRRDSIVIGVVIGLCIVISLLYAFS